MARVLAARLAGTPNEAGFATPDLSTKLKLLGVDVASFGDAFAAGPGVDVLTWSDSSTGIHKRLARRSVRRPLARRDAGR